MGLLDSFAQAQPQAPTGGLLGQGFADPRSAAIMALAGGLMRGDAGGGFMGASNAFQSALNGQIDRADKAQQIGLRNVQLQQAMQQWKMMQPILQQVSNELGGGGAAGAPAQPTQPAIAPESGGQLGSGTFGIPMGGQPAASAPASQGNAFSGGGGGSVMGLPRSVALTSLAFGGPGKFADAVTQYNTPTDLMKTLIAQGVQPGSPQWAKALSDNVAKLNNIPLQAGRAGAPMYRSDGTIVAMAPKIPDNAIPQVVDGRVVGVTPLPGASNIVQTNAYAAAAGGAQTKPRTAYALGSTQPVFTNDLVAAQGGYAPQAGPAGVTQAIGGNPDAASTPEQRATGDVASLTREIAMVNKSMDPPQIKQQRLSILNAEMAKAQAQLPQVPLVPEPALGTAQGATLSQDELSRKAAALMSDNGQTNTVISRLQNIKMLAPGAITGAETGRRDFMNGLLSLAGIPAASDAKTASDLVDKNAAQITSALRMGQGGAGTDALQTLISAANPNRHMTPDAINEAVDQLVASQKMIQSKAQILQPHYLARDPVAYGQKELAFDQNADPRVWQLQAMTPQQQSSYVKTLPPAVAADMLKKRQALKQIGALQ